MARFLGGTKSGAAKQDGTAQLAKWLVTLPTACWKLHISSNPSNSVSEPRPVTENIPLVTQAGGTATVATNDEAGNERPPVCGNKLTRQRNPPHREPLSYRAKPYSTLPCRDQFVNAAADNFLHDPHKITVKKLGSMEHCTLRIRPNHDCVCPHSEARNCNRAHNACTLSKCNADRH